MRPWAFLLLAVLGAVWQAWTEVADTSLRLPAAMAVLAMLLSSGNVSGDIPAGRYGAAFGLGAVWQALVQCVGARRVAAPNGAPAAEFAAVFSAAAAARRFISVIAALALVAGGIVLALPVPHAAWLLTAALRVMKPSQGQTLQRLRQGSSAPPQARYVLLAFWPAAGPAARRHPRRHANDNAVGRSAALRAVDVLPHRHCP
jgi:hypothetical protein